MKIINENAKTIQSYLADIDAEIEVNFTGDEIEIYWENLRVKVKPAEFKTALDSIEQLVKLEAYFG